ncbi:MAG: purine-nucleoside phosphorylase [Microthrixaceae bacterium]
MTSSNTPGDPWAAAEADATVLVDRLGPFESAVVLGSGWASVGEQIGTRLDEMPMADLHGLPDPGVQGHGATISLVEVESKRVLVLAGRIHLYEGHSAHTVVHAVRCAVLGGCGQVLLTNAAGSLRPEVGIGTPVVITDQLNLSGANPLAGAAPPESMGARFADLTGLYDPALVQAALAVDDGAVPGVYAGLLGGSFETPAEIRMLAMLGADVVGMSTVLEAIAARHLGASVFGVSLVTNLAAGLQSELDHLEVLAAGKQASSRLVEVLRAVLRAG